MVIDNKCNIFHPAVTEAIEIPQFIGRSYLTYENSDILKRLMTQIHTHTHTHTHTQSDPHISNMVWFGIYFHVHDGSLLPLLSHESNSS